MWDAWNAILAHLYSDVTLIEVFRSLSCIVQTCYMFFFTLAALVSSLFCLSIK